MEVVENASKIIVIFWSEEMNAIEEYKVLSVDVYSQMSALKYLYRISIGFL